MAKTNPRVLFFQAFKAFNQQRYAGSRVDKPRFQGLQMSELVFGNLKRTPETQTVVIDTITSASRRFNAVNQSFIRCQLSDAGIAAIKSTGYPYEDITTMKALAEAGLNAYMNPAQDAVLIAVVFPESVADDPAEITQVVETTIIDACNYEIKPEEITVSATEDPKLWTVSVDSEIIYAELIAVRSEMPVLDIPATDYGHLSTPIQVPNPYPPVQGPQ
ncbi:hypothetical protein [Shewanella phage FishSpeaker]|nr:hypothetical protein [Shewanella phage FishSpeaker]